MTWKRWKSWSLVLVLAALSTFNPAMSTELQKAAVFVWTVFVFYTIHLLTQAVRWMDSRFKP